MEPRPTGEYYDEGYAEGLLGIEDSGTLLDLFDAARRMVICAGVGFAAGAAVGIFVTPDAAEALKQLPAMTQTADLLGQHAIGGGILGAMVGVILSPLSYDLFPRRFGRAG